MSTVPSRCSALAHSAQPLAVLADYEPAFHHYELLREALGRYRALAAQPAPAPLPSTGRPSVKPGEHYAAMPALRARGWRNSGISKDPR